MSKSPIVAGTGVTRQTIQRRRKRWIEELRSGRRKQAKGVLSRCKKDGTETSSCCLGVASDVAGAAFTVVHPDVGGSTANYIREYRDESGRTSQGALTGGMQEWLGVATDNPRLALPSEHKYSRKHGPQPDLACLNDEGVKFSEIADLIETYGFYWYDDMLQDDAPA